LHVTPGTSGTSRRLRGPDRVRHAVAVL